MNNTTKQGKGSKAVASHIKQADIMISLWKFYKKEGYLPNDFFHITQLMERYTKDEVSTHEVDGVIDTLYNVWCKP